MDRILMATDFSDFSKEALDQAVYLAEALGAELYLLHVFEPPFFTPPGISIEDARRWVDHVKSEESKRLRALVEEVRRQGIKAHELLREGRAVLEINRTAEEISARFVVLGSHGRSGMDRFLIGSVAERVARSCPASVLIVGPKAVHGKEGAKESPGRRTKPVGEGSKGPQTAAENKTAS